MTHNKPAQFKLYQRINALVSNHFPGKTRMYTRDDLINDVYVKLVTERDNLEGIEDTEINHLIKRYGIRRDRDKFPRFILTTCTAEDINESALYNPLPEPMPENPLFTVLAEAFTHLANPDSQLLADLDIQHNQALYEKLKAIRKTLPKQS